MLSLYPPVFGIIFGKVGPVGVGLEGAGVGSLGAANSSLLGKDEFFIYEILYLYCLLPVEQLSDID